MSKPRMSDHESQELKEATKKVLQRSQELTQQTEKLLKQSHDLMRYLHAQQQARHPAIEVHRRLRTR